MPGASQHRSFELIGSEGAIVIQPIEPGTRMRVSMREARGPYRAGWQDVEMASQPRYVGDFRELARAIRTCAPLKYSYDYELPVEESCSGPRVRWPDGHPKRAHLYWGHALSMLKRIGAASHASR